MRVVTFTDSHIRSTKPEGRTETEWLDVCLGQVEAVLAFAQEQQAQYVLCSGDVFDSPGSNAPAIVGLIDLLKQYEIPLVTIPGQHDVYGHRVHDWQHTALGIVAKVTDLCTVLTGGEEYRLSHNISVHGFSFNEPATLELLRGVWRPERRKDKVNPFRIALVHAQVGPEESMGWAGIANQNLRAVNLAQFGDIHCGFAPYKFDHGDTSCVAYNPGSLTRTSRADRGRVPGLVQVDIDDDDLTYELAFYDVDDGPDDVVFYPVDAVVADVDSAENFKSILSAARSYKDESPRIKLARVGETGEYTKKQIALAVDRLEEDN